METTEQQKEFKQIANILGGSVKQAKEYQESQRREKLALAFHGCKDPKAKENAPILSSVMTNSFCSPMLQKRNITEQQKSFFDELANIPQPELEEKQQSKEEYIAYKVWRPDVWSFFFMEGGNAILGAITNPNGKPYFNELEIENGNITLWATWDQLKKCFFGPCVDEFGNLKRGTATALKDSGLLSSFFSSVFDSLQGTEGKEPTLYCYNKEGHFLKSCRPIIFSGYDTEKQAFKVLLDPLFFSFQKGDKSLKAKGSFFPALAGVLPMCMVGRSLVDEEKEQARENGVQFPNALTAAKFYYTLQAGKHYQLLNGVKEYSGEIALSKEALGEIFPDCWNGQGGFSMKKAQQKAALCSDILFRGIFATGTLKELANREKTAKTPLKLIYPAILNANERKPYCSKDKSVLYCPVDLIQDLDRITETLMPSVIVATVLELLSQTTPKKP